MNKNRIRIAACALAGTVALSGYYTSIQAKINTSSLVPAAGIAVALEEGTTIQELTREVVQNIAYLESASGIQPNIVIASEKIALAEEPTTVDNEAESTEGLSEEADDISTKTDDDDFRISAGFSGSEICETEAVLEEEITEEAQMETTEESSELETTEEMSTEETTQTEEQDFRGLVIAQVNNYVNVRSIPSEEGEIVGKLYDKSVGEFVEEQDGWYKIVS